MKNKWIVNWLPVPVMLYIWIFGLAYGAGAGKAYDIYGKTSIVVWILIFFFIFVEKSFTRIPKSVIWFGVYYLCVSAYTYIKYGHTTFRYIWVYLLIPLIALMPIKKGPMWFISMMYGFLGLAVLYMRNYSDVFDGWNPNSIGNIAFFSMSVMIMAFHNLNNLYSIPFLIIYFYLYYEWTAILDSRTGALFGIIMALCIPGVIPIKKIIKNPLGIGILLLAPLIVAVVSGFFFDEATVAKLDEWSYNIFDKPFFNGRDEFSRWGLEYWKGSPLFGYGNLAASNWHNSAVTMLVGAGAVGYGIWIYFTHSVLKKGIPYLKDTIVSGLVIGFLMIWFHQALELGMVWNEANPIPYAMLGLLLGRIKTLKKEELLDEEDKGINNSSRIQFGKIS